jgi:hypothetical protein
MPREKVGEQPATSSDAARSLREFISLLVKWDWFVTITFKEITARDLAVARIEEWLADIQGAWAANKSDG